MITSNTPRVSDVIMPLGGVRPGVVRLRGGAA
jgi:hypothetical protein